MLLACLAGHAQDEVKHPKNSYQISGIVRDAVTYEPIPYASVTAVGKAAGALTNEKGIFEITVDDNTSKLQVACTGYDKANVNVQKGYINLYDIKLQPITTALKELVVQRKKYSKKNNPAVAFAKNLRLANADTDPERNPYYNYNKHQVTTLALNDFGPMLETGFMSKEFPFFWNYVDTSEVSGKPILNLMIKEKNSDVHYRKSPKARTEVIKGTRQEGIDEVLDEETTTAFFDEVMREIDLYDEDVVIFNNHFVSPLSRIAPDFYRFYLTDTVMVDSVPCSVLSFYPRNNSMLGFNGQLYVPVADSTLFVKKVTMRTTPNINLNFVKEMYISQEFKRAADGSRLKLRDDLTAEVSPLANKSGIYVRRNVAYDNHNFDKAEDESVYSALTTVVTDPDAHNRSSEYWDETRQLELTDNELGVGNLMSEMRKKKWYKWTEKAVKILATGYIETGKPSKFDIGPILSTVSFNNLEGWRFRAGGLTTAALSRRVFARGYVAYGIRDHKWKYKAEAEYSFVDKDKHARQFPIRSIRFSSEYDILRIGMHHRERYADNILASLRRMNDNHTGYRHLNSLSWIWEFDNHFSFDLSANHEILYASRLLKFVDGYGKNYNHFPESYLKLELRYSPHEKFYQTRTDRRSVNHDALVLKLTHIFAPKGVFGSTFGINRTELSVEKRFWFSAFGYLDSHLSGGHVWGTTPFTSLFTPAANLSYLLVKDYFNLLNPMEFISDTYAALTLYYHANGAILNHIPFIKKLKLREVFSFKGYWGTLSKRNDPANDPSLLQFPEGARVSRLGKAPYMEVSAGLDNIFKLLRLEWVYRINYRNVPYPIDKWGIRFSVHIAF